MQILSNPISALNVRTKFSRLLGNWGRGTWWWRQILDRKWKYIHLVHAQWKICNITLIYGQIAKISASLRKSGSRNTTVTSDYRPKVKIWLFCACAMKTMQYNQWKVSNIAFIYGRITEIFAVFSKSGSRYTMVTSDFRPEVEIRPFRASAMHPAIIIGTVRLLWNWLWGRYHVPQNVFLVIGVRL